MQCISKTKTRQSKGDELTELNISSSIRKRKASESPSSEKNRSTTISASGSNGSSSDHNKGTATMIGTESHKNISNKYL